MNTPCIMLIDESEFFLDLEQKFLKDSDLKVIPMSCYATAKIELQQIRPDLIFMDIGAPGMDGVKLCTELKQQNIYAGIPVVMLYSRTQAHEKLQCLNTGCQGVLSKPLERTTFLSMGRKFLPSVEQRVQRALCSTTVFFRSESLHHYAASMDISEGGMFLETDYPAQLDEFLDIAFNLPGQVSQIIEVRARVVWVNMEKRPLRPSYPLGAGVEFVNLPETSAALIRKFVEANASLQGGIEEWAQ